MARGAEVPVFVNLANQFRRAEKYTALPQGFSYDDVYVEPGHSRITTLDAVSTRTLLVEGIPLQIPIVSANMDSVTEAPMAEAVAKRGGIGILHRAMTIEEQARQVRIVKDATRYIVDDPPRLSVESSVKEARGVMEERQRGFVIIVDGNGKLLGMVTPRDVPVEEPETEIVANAMTPKDRLHVAPPNISLKDAQKLMYKYRVEKLPLIDGEGNIMGVITNRDIREMAKYPNATKDEKGRLRVGAAVGIQSEVMERAQELVKAGVDVLVVDVLHGDSVRVLEVTKMLATAFPSVPIISGNVAKAGATDRLIDAGAKGVKVGYGDGALCTTRVKTGTGAPQFTAVVKCAAAAYKTNPKITIIADGSIRAGGDALKALVAGGNTVMVGTALTGTDQSPGDILVDDLRGDRYKQVRGMASTPAQEKLARVRGDKPKKRVAQGVSARVAYVGDVDPIIDELVGGLVSGIANVGATSIEELQIKAKVGHQTVAGSAEGRPHIQTSKYSR